ncbi:MAG: class I SAM-dependent methyltransferase [Gemmatimonadales bacterium]
MKIGIEQWLWRAAFALRQLLRGGKRGASNTALGVMAIRAAHQLIDGEPKILDDPIAVRLLAPRTIARIVRYGRDERDRRVDGLRAHIVTRSRYAEDRLAEAAARGVRQYVILGAGYDTFAYRQPLWARELKVFEVDHPASQDAKRDRLTRAGIALPDNLTFVAIDFEKMSLAEGLAAGGVDLDQPAFFSWLGVLVYLTEEAIDAVFRAVAQFPKESEIVLTFSPPDPDGVGRGLATRVAAMGEPWRTRLEPEALVEKLRRSGFVEAGLADPAELTERYFTERTDGLQAPRRERLAWGRS